MVPDLPVVLLVESNEDMLAFPCLFIHPWIEVLALRTRFPLSVSTDLRASLSAAGRDVAILGDCTLPEVEGRIPSRAHAPLLSTDPRPPIPSEGRTVRRGAAFGASREAEGTGTKELEKRAGCCLTGGGRGADWREA
mmetsp:Transcript_32840/g.103855  ORF Transcript_32840/g.103855 Transcript_32840/m.103855 type:complete len:137 (-) Transcript_32840:115-525(-)